MTILIDTECPICMMPFMGGRLRDGMRNIDETSPCCHYFCRECLQQMSDRRMAQCPLCRYNISSLLNVYISPCEEDDNTDIGDDDNADYSEDGDEYVCIEEQEELNRNIFYSYFYGDDDTDEELDSDDDDDDEV